MIKEDIFSTFILEDNIKVNVSELNKYAYELKNKNIKTKRIPSTQGGFHSDDLHLEEPVLQPLIKAITKMSYVYCRELKVKEKYALSLANMWFVINNQNHYNSPHNHPFSFLSGAFYTKSGADSGDIVFLNPNPKIEGYWFDGAWKEYNMYQSGSIMKESLTNKIILFPSWLAHHVTPNQTKEDRIVWSFNIQLI